MSSVWTSHETSFDWDFPVEGFRDKNSEFVIASIEGSWIEANGLILKEIETGYNLKYERFGYFGVRVDAFKWMRARHIGVMELVRLTSFKPCYSFMRGKL